LSNGDSRTAPGRRSSGAAEDVDAADRVLDRGEDQALHPLALAERPMSGWVIPPPSQSVKSDEDLRRERETKIAELGRRGLLRSERLRRAMLIVGREDFIPSPYRDHAYEEVPLPLPGEWATISCPHSYPLFYEPLGLGERHRFLEVGVGSGYGAALAREVVGREGLVVAVAARRRVSSRTAARPPR
jgi:hypothetical protein